MFAEKNDLTWSGGDQMTSYLAPNGRIYWTSGDTMLSQGESPDGSYPPGSRMVSNRVLIQAGASLTNATSTDVAVPNPPTSTPENQERYWTQGMFYANSYLYVLSQRVTSQGSSFTLKGVELARFSIARSGMLTFRGMVTTPSTGVHQGNGPAHIQWGADAVQQDKYSYLYVFGYSHNADIYNPIQSYVARVPGWQVENPFAWKYWNGGAWVAGMSNAKAIINSQVSSARIIKGKWRLLHKPWSGYGDKVYMESGFKAQGPYTQRLLFSSPAGTTQQGFKYQTYGPMLHPEQTLASGKLLVSIDWNGQDFFADTLRDADLYKPRFYEVAL
jgi:hypothetical protein